MIKLVVSDMDGTIVRNKKISIQTYLAVEQLKEAGYLFTVVTGRHYTTAKPLIDSLNIDIPVVCSNGSLIVNPKTHEVISSVFMNEEFVKTVINKLNRNHVTYCIYTSSDIITTEEGKMEIYNVIGKAQVVVVAKDELNRYLSQGVIKILVIEHNEVKYDVIRNYIVRSNIFAATMSQKGFLDIGSKDASKGKALFELCNYLKIPIENTLAIGDEHNDLTMIRSAHIGIAMGNGSEEVKLAANYVTDTVENEGFSKAMKEHLYK